MFLDQARKVAYLGILTALALALAWVERFIPLALPVPGVKLGLANIVTLLSLYLLGTKVGFWVMLSRVLIAGALFSGISGIIYGLSGGFFAYAVMIALKSTKKPTIIGVSVAGAVAHNIGQIMIAAVIVENIEMFRFLPILTITGAAAGMLTGFAAALVYKRLISVRFFQSG
ncbi:MAG: Gx transporter family protein [Defluviitaleaceae bacterium]|nr:Gx transporter family protein [Defluviitaleaceae bacterium]